MTPFDLWWGLARVGLTMATSCTLMPWIVWQELVAPPDRETRTTAKVLPFRSRR